MEETNQAPQAENVETKNEAAPDLNISDLIAIRNILDAASQRGAFKASEMEAVGKVYNKLNNFLEAAAKKE
jgi:hypothetical protein